MKEWKRIVVKVGTSTVCHPNGAANLRRIEQLVRVLSDLKNTGIEIILVTSGAIGVGTQKIGWKERPKTVSGRQAAAAIGQCELMSIYDRLFMDYGSKTAQLLLTKDVFEDSKERNNVIATFKELGEIGAIPIVNENDSVATEEIVYGDNDTLSAVVAKYVKADLLILFTDIDGLYDANPDTDPNAKLISVVNDIDEVLHLAEDSKSGLGTGGMKTKLTAAKIAQDAGISTLIASSENPSLIYDILDGKKVGTLIKKKEVTK